jgi:hypothetical protein
MLAGRYFYGSLAQSPTTSVPAESSVSGMSPQPAERSSSASVTPTQETTALEETTSFQAPEGTRASTPARIACLRADQGASSPPNNMEALNSGVLTRVLTPKVEAQPDGLHLQIDNRVGEDAAYSIKVAGATSGESYESGDYLRKGVTNDVIVAPPGIAEIQCYPSENYDFTEQKYASFEVVEGDSGYKSLELECKPGMEGRFVGTMASGAGSKFELVSYRDPVDEARDYFKEGLREGDVVEAAGYPEDPDPTVRVVRNGRVVATAEFGSMNMYATYCEGDI